MTEISDPFHPDPAPEPVWGELAKIVLGAQPLDQTLQRIAEIALQVIPELVDVSITLIEDERPRTVVFTGALAVELDERQYTDGHGPCTDAAVSGTTILLLTIGENREYPAFTEAAAGRGITSTLSVGLPIPQRIAGALNMYSAADQPISSESVATAQQFAVYAAVAIANATLYQATADTAVHMSTALKSRAVIDQAKGIIMSQRRCDAEEAFLVLVRSSQQRNQKLHAVAGAVVASSQA